MVRVCVLGYLLELLSSENIELWREVENLSYSESHNPSLWTGGTKGHQSKLDCTLLYEF